MVNGCVCVKHREQNVHRVELTGKSLMMCVCREKKLTFVVVDPLLTAVLRPHQREVFFFACCSRHLNLLILQA